MTVLLATQVRRRLDLFRCEPYHANITAGTCLARQAKHAQGADPELVRRGHEPGDYSLCGESCPLGAIIRAQVSDGTGMVMSMSRPANYMPPIASSAAFLRSQKTEKALDEAKPKQRRRTMRMAKG